MCTSITRARGVDDNAALMAVCCDAFLGGTFPRAELITKVEKSLAALLPPTVLLHNGQFAFNLNIQNEYDSCIRLLNLLCDCPFNNLMLHSIQTFRHAARCIALDIGAVRLIYAAKRSVNTVTRQNGHRTGSLTRSLTLPGDLIRHDRLTLIYRQHRAVN